MGININDAFPSKWMKASDLEGRQPRMTVADVRMEDIGDDGHKPVIYFHGTDKGIVLNKTNATNISQAYGPNTDGWRGKDVVLFTTWVDFNGRSVEAIRIRPDTAKQFVSGLPDRDDRRSVNAPLDMDDSAANRDFAPLEDL